MMRTRSAALLALLVASPAGAQGPPARDSVVELPGVEVVGSILAGSGPGVGAGAVRAVVVEATELSAWEPRLLAEALAARPGFALYDDLGSPFKRTLVARGFTAGPVVGLPQGVSIFLDGVPVNEPDAGQVNFDLLPLEHVQRVEILSGTAPLLGPNSLGGAVNLVTRRGRGRPAGEVEVGAGSFGAYSADGSVGGGIGGWGYYAGGGVERERGWRQLTGARLANLFANVGQAGARGSLNLQLLGARSYAETAGSLPSSVYPLRPDSNFSAGDFEDLSQLHLALSGHRSSRRGRVSFSAYLRGNNGERFNVNQENDPDVRSFAENRTVGGGADWRAAHAIGGTMLGVRAGVSGSTSRVDIRIFAERIDPGLTTHVRSPSKEGALYATLDLARGPVTLSTGARYDVAYIPFRNLLDPARDTASLYRRLSPRGGVEVDAGRGVSLYASYGRGFRTPAVIELACADPENPCPLPFALGDDPPLDPVVAATWEGGGRWIRGLLAAQLSAYRTSVRDDIFLVPYREEDEPEGSTIDGYFINVPETRREGVEAEARLAIGRIELEGGYAFTRATFRSGGFELFSIRGENEVEPGDRLPLVPEHGARLGARLRLPAGFGLGARAEYVGSRRLRGDESNEEKPLDPYLLAHLQAEYAFRDWEIVAMVRNALDARYEAFGTFNLDQGGGGEWERFLTPGAPRTLRLLLRRRFGG